MKYILIVIAAICNYIAYSQPFKPQKLRAIDYRFVLKDEDGNFVDAYDWAATNLLVVLDIQNEKIRIYSKELQEFDIVDSDPLEEDKYGNKWLKYACVDRSAAQCTIRMVSYKKAFKDAFGKLFAASMYIEYKDDISQYRLTINNP